MLEREIFVRHKATPSAPIPSQEDVDVFMQFMQQVGQEDYDLCELAQRNLDAGIYSRGRLHPTAEAGVSWYQGLVRDNVAGWIKARKSAA
jgi:hypothetical protein